MMSLENDIFTMTNKEKSKMAKEILKDYRILKRMKIVESLRPIEAALDNCAADKKELLYQKFCICPEPTNISIYLNLHLSESKYYRDLGKALVEFAECYAGERNLFGGVSSELAVNIYSNLSKGMVEIAEYERNNFAT